jgi:hypothetical protein
MDWAWSGVATKMAPVTQPHRPSRLVIPTERQRREWRDLLLAEKQIPRLRRQCRLRSG